MPRSSIETYAALIAERRPERILELGISMGGSTVLLAELARPTKLVAIDLKPLMKYGRARPNSSLLRLQSV